MLNEKLNILESRDNIDTSKIEKGLYSEFVETYLKYLKCKDDIIEAQDYFDKLVVQIKKILSKLTGYTNLDNYAKDEVISIIIYYLHLYIDKDKIKHYGSGVQILKNLYKLASSRVMGNVGVVTYPSYLFSGSKSEQRETVREKYVRGFSILKLDTAGQDYEEEGLGPVLKADSNQASDYTYNQLKQSIDEFLNTKRPEYRQIYKYRILSKIYGQKKTLNELGQELGMSRERVRQLENSLIEELFGFLKRKGYNMQNYALLIKGNNKGKKLL